MTMTATRSWGWPIALLAALLLMLACGDDDETTDAGNAADAGADTGGGASDVASAAEWAPTVFRVNELAVNRPAALGTILQGLINRDIGTGLLNILIETSDFGADTGATTFMIAGGAGEAVDGADDTYRFMEAPTPVPAQVEADGSFANTEPLTLDFPVLFTFEPSCDGGSCPDDRCRTADDCPDGFSCDSEGDGLCIQWVIIPLKDVTIDGTFQEADGAQVLRGADLEGAILKEDADGLQVDMGGTLVVLTTLLNERNMDYPEDSQPKTGWILSGRINANQVTLE
jgi:hypothetical protein